MPTLQRPAAFAALVVLVAACGSSTPSGSPGASAPPSGAPSSTPILGPIDHATGSTDVILRLEESGGFVPQAFLATQAPIFTLYGDGTIIFRSPRLDPPPAVGSARPLRPFRIAHLSEAQIQATLALAVGEGGLGTARPNYPNDRVADASTAVFTLVAGGIRKTVSVYALGLEMDGVPDALPRAAFAKLAEHLGDFDLRESIRTDVYAPERYRGILLDGQAGDPGVKRWPWADLKPTDFVVPADANAAQLPVRVLTVAQVEALGIQPYQGGIQGPTLIGPDGRFYAFSLRPLLPEESR